MTLPISSSTTITWSYSDGTNVSTQTQQVIINDTTAPTPDALTLAPITAQCQVTALTPPTATDNCGGTVIVTNNVTLPISSSTTITWSYSDGTNVSTQTQQVIINDTINPLCVTKDITIQLDGTGNATILASEIDNGSSDNCGIASIFVTPNTFTFSNIGNNTVSFTVTDTNGNSSTCNAIVTVETQTLSAEDNDKIELFNITPNPFNEDIYIKIPSKYNGDTFDITIYDINGRKVFNKLYNSSSNEIRLDNLSRLQKAPYILKIKNTRDNSSLTKRLLKY